MSRKWLSTLLKDLINEPKFKKRTGYSAGSLRKGLAEGAIKGVDWQTLIAEPLKKN